MSWYLKVMKQYADFNGRARRTEYWMFILFYLIFVMALSFVGGMLLGESGGGLLVNLLVLAHLCPAIAVGVRRMHDTNRPGWWIIVPFINIYFAVLEGTRGPNQYGPDPKAGG